MIEFISDKEEIDFKEDVVTFTMVNYLKAHQEEFMITGRQRGKWLA
jgi:hypothetical protein